MRNPDFTGREGLLQWLSPTCANRRVSERTLAASRRRRGDRHPDTLGCALNTALDLAASGDEIAGQALLNETSRSYGYNSVRNIRPP